MKKEEEEEDAGPAEAPAPARQRTVVRTVLCSSALQKEIAEGGEGYCLHKTGADARSRASAIRGVQVRYNSQCEKQLLCRVRHSYSVHPRVHRGCAKEKITAQRLAMMLLLLLLLLLGMVLPTRGTVVASHVGSVVEETAAGAMP